MSQLDRNTITQLLGHARVTCADEPDLAAG
jgi:hypothetical protein